MNKLMKMTQKHKNVKILCRFDTRSRRYLFLLIYLVIFSIVILWKASIKIKENLENIGYEFYTGTGRG